MHILESLGTINKPKLTQLNKRGFYFVEDFTEFAPRQYIDARKITPRSEFEHGKWATVMGVVRNKVEKSNVCYLDLVAEDKTRTRVTWFGSSYTFRNFKEGEMVYACGKLSEWNGYYGLNVPFKISQDKSKVMKIHPIYKKKTGVSEAFISEKIKESVAFMRGISETYHKQQLAKSLGFSPYASSMEQLHYPKTTFDIDVGRDRLKFEKLYRFYEELNKKAPKSLGPTINKVTKVQDTINFYQNCLPYKLTTGQQEAVQAFYAKASSLQKVNSLVSGDVGCGKTVVAMIDSLLMVENGHQVAVMAPTVVLARQHFEEFTKTLEPVKINDKSVVVEFLTGKTPKSARKKILERVEKGEVDILIGTHAVASEEVAFQNLGLMVVDEEHKFGVAQKTKILEASPTIHYVAMTATPIPRSIGLSLYGNDVELLPIATMPAGRKPVITSQFFETKTMFDKVMEEIEKGHQAYIIAPLIEQSESEKMQGVLSVAEAEVLFKDYLAEHHPKSTCKVASINGKMSEKEVMEGIESFASHEADVLISTTIVEVGVNVPNATAICILSAERFGLAALHQLRGRVGRKGDQGYCLLYSEKRTERLDVICSETNGFVIAEEDLRLRGAGDLIGESQKGFSEIIDIILAEPDVAKAINEAFRK